MLVSEDIEVDLRRLTPFRNRIVPGVDTEIKLIESYRYLQSEESSILMEYTDYLLKYLFQDDKEHTYSEIKVFFKEREYIHKVMYFLDILETYLLSNIDPNFVNITFDRYKDKDKNIGVFKVWHIKKDSLHTNQL